MKLRHTAFILIVFTTLISCDKKLNLSYVSMDLPLGWSYEPGNGTDSFVGTINTLGNKLTFEYSANGYANSLLLTEKQYLSDQTNWAASTCYFCKPGITYAPKADVAKQKLLLAKQSGVNDTALVKVEPDIEYSKSIQKSEGPWRRYYPGADYIAELKYRDSTIYVPIYIPQSTKKHNITIDTTAKYIIKTMWPVVPEDGITAVYVKSRTTKMNFNMQGTNLSKGDEERALKAFKTIRLKE